MENSTQLIQRKVGTITNLLKSVDLIDSSFATFIRLALPAEQLKINKYLNLRPKKTNNESIINFLEYLKFVLPAPEKAIYRLNTLLGGSNFEGYKHIFVLNHAAFTNELVRPDGKSVAPYNTPLEFANYVINLNSFKDGKWQDVGVFTFKDEVTSIEIDYLKIAIETFNNNESALYDVPVNIVKCIKYLIDPIGGGRQDDNFVIDNDVRDVLPQDVLAILQSIFYTEKVQEKIGGKESAGVAFDHLSKLPFIGEFNLQAHYFDKDVICPLFEMFGVNKYTRRVDDFLKNTSEIKHVFEFNHCVDSCRLLKIAVLPPNAPIELRKELKKKVLTAIYESLTEESNISATSAMCYAILFLYYSGMYNSVVHEQLLKWSSDFNIESVRVFLSAVNVNTSLYSSQTVDVSYDTELERLFCLCSENKGQRVKRMTKQDVSELVELFNYIDSKYILKHRGGANDEKTIFTKQQYQTYIPHIILAMCDFKLVDPPPLLDDDRIDKTSKSEIPYIGWSFNKYKEVLSKYQSTFEGLFQTLVLRPGSTYTYEWKNDTKSFYGKVASLCNTVPPEFSADDSAYIISKLPALEFKVDTLYHDGFEEGDTLKVTPDTSSGSKFHYQLTFLDKENTNRIKTSTDVVPYADIDTLSEIFDNKTNTSKSINNVLKKRREINDAYTLAKAIIASHSGLPENIDKDDIGEKIDYIMKNTGEQTINYIGKEILATFFIDENTDADSCRFIPVPIYHKEKALARIILDLMERKKENDNNGKLRKYLNDFTTQLSIKQATQNLTLRSQASFAVSTILKLTGFEVSQSVENSINVLHVKNYSPKLMGERLLKWKIPNSIIESIIRLIAELAISFLLTTDGKNSNGGNGGSDDVLQDIKFALEFTQLSMNDSIDPIFRDCINQKALTGGALAEYISYCERNNDSNLDIFSGETKQVQKCVEDLIRQDKLNSETLDTIVLPYQQKIHFFMKQFGYQEKLSGGNPCNFLQEIKNYLGKLKVLSVDNEKIAELVSKELTQHWPFLKDTPFATLSTNPGLDPVMYSMIVYLQNHCNDKLPTEAKSKLFDEIKKFMILQRNCQNFLMILQMANSFVQVVRRTAKIPQEEILKNYVEIIKIVLEYVEPKLREMMLKQQDFTERCLKKYKNSLGLSENDTDFNIQQEFTAFIQKLLGVDIAELIPANPVCPITPSDDKVYNLSDFKLFF